MPTHERAEGDGSHNEAVVAERSGKPHLDARSPRTQAEQDALTAARAGYEASPANWPSPADIMLAEEHKHSAGAKLLDAIAAYIRRYVVATPHEVNALALWVAHCWLIDAFDVTGRIVLQSAEPRCGKSRVLEVLERLVRSSLFTNNTTVAALFRSVDAESTRPPVIPFDETETTFGPKANGQGAEEKRAFINSGYRRGVKVLRIVGEGSKMTRREFATFAPLALAGLGQLPTTVLDRSIVVHLKRKAKHERAEKFRHREAEEIASPLRRRLERWCTKKNIEWLRAARPVMPDQINDRAEEVWEPLFAISDLAGGHWPARVRDACLALCDTGDVEQATTGVRLLTDCWTAFSEDERLLTTDLLARLHALEESPWKDWGGFGGADAHPLTARELANKLRPYGISSTDFRTGSGARKGYRRADFADAWSRYIPSLAAPAAPAATDQVRAVADGKPVADTSATLFDPVADTAATENSSATGATREVAAGADGTREEGHPAAVTDGHDDHAVVEPTSGATPDDGDEPW